MLKLEIQGAETFNNETEEFSYEESVELHLEHTLVSISKWESKWEIPYLSDKKKTTEQTLDYIRCMCVNRDVSDEVLTRLTDENAKAIEKYITSKHTATWFSEKGSGKPNRETITAELVYYWIVTLNIDWEVQHWHFNKLMTLIEICHRKSDKPKKMSKAEQAAQNRKLNQERRARLGSSG